MVSWAGFIFLSVCVGGGIVSPCQIDLKSTRLPVSDQLKRGLHGVISVLGVFCRNIKINKTIMNKSVKLQNYNYSCSCENACVERYWGLNLEVK